MPWIARDLTLTAHAHFTVSDISGYDFPDDKSMHIVYSAETQDNDFFHKDVHELYTGIDRVWHYTNLTSDSGGETASSSAQGYADDTEGYQHAIYHGSTFEGLGNRIKEIYWQSEEKFQNDLNTAANAPVPANTYAIFGCGRDFGAQHVFYVGIDNHLWHLERQYTQGWISTDLTFTQGAPTPDSRPVAFYVANAFRFHVAYKDSKRNLIVLTRDRLGSWTANNLTTTFGVTAVATGVVGIATGIGSNIFIHYRGDDGHLNQVHWSGNPAETPTERSLSAELGLPHMEYATEANNYFLTGDATFHVIYNALDGKLYEIYADQNFNWQARNMLDGNDGGEPLQSRRAAFVFSQDNSQHVVYARKHDFHVIELTWQNERRHWPWLAQLIKVLRDLLRI
jgi:hypothetical protein